MGKKGVEEIYKSTMISFLLIYLLAYFFLLVCCNNDNDRIWVWVI